MMRAMAGPGKTPQSANDDRDEEVQITCAGFARHGRGQGVETKSHGTKVPSPSRTYEYTPKKVTWKDIILPRRKPTSSPSPRTTK